MTGMNNGSGLKRKTLAKKRHMRQRTYRQEPNHCSGSPTR
jgi:hypothetical protein